MSKEYKFPVRIAFSIKMYWKEGEPYETRVKTFLSQKEYDDYYDEVNRSNMKIINEIELIENNSK